MVYGRDKNYVQITQIVCPFGKVLCADLTCKDNIIFVLTLLKFHWEEQDVLINKLLKYVYECSITITYPDKNK